MTRAEAASLGLNKYRTGKPCRQGHVSCRLTSNAGCIECANDKARQRYEENPERYRAKRRKYAASHREQETAYYRGYYGRTIEKQKEKNLAYRKANPQYFASKAAERRALMQFPIWVTDEERQAIKEFYINCPEGHHVDHTIPLKGKNVCGLHVLDNLQYLTQEENLRKGNKFN